MSDKPSLLLVAASDRRRGAEVFGSQLVEGLGDRGWSVEGVCLSRGGDGSRVDLEPLTDLTQGELGKFNRTAYLALRRRVRRSKPRVIVTMGGPTLRYGAAARTGSTKLAYVSIGEPNFWIRSAFSKALNGYLIRRADLVIAVSSATADQTAELFPEMAPRTFVAHTGVPDDLLEVESRRTEGDLRVLVVGSLSSEKDPLLAAQVIAERDGVSARFVGSGPLADAVAELGQPGSGIELVGAVDDLRPHWEWADLLMLTSQTEGLPGVVLEAAAAGVPALAVDVGGVSEAVEHGVSGLVVERSPEALARGLDKLIEDRDHLAALSEEGRKRVATTFTLDAAHARYDELLRKLI